MKKEYYKYPIYQRDGQNLIEIMKVTRMEYEKLYEQVKKDGRELILFRGTFLVFKKKKGTETQKTMD